MRLIFSVSMKELHLDVIGPPGQPEGAAPGRVIARLLQAATSLVTDLTNTLLPSDCRLCAAPMVAFGKVRVCEDCIARIDPQDGPGQQQLLCSRCGDALGMESARFGASLGLTECTACRLAPPEFTRAVAFADYDKEMREMLRLLKFSRQRHIAEHVLGQRMADAILKLFGQTSDEITVIPVPLFAARERQRGFNQANLLALAALKRLRRSHPQWNLHINNRALGRIKDTHALYVLNPSQRRQDLRGAFRVIDPVAVRGHEVLLIDDIMTTGATARECSRVLLAAGAAKVWVATAARAQPESSSNVARTQIATQTTAAWDAPPSPKPRLIEPVTGRQTTF